MGFQGYGLLVVAGVMMVGWLIVGAILLGLVCPMNAIMLLLALCVGTVLLLSSYRRVG